MFRCLARILSLSDLELKTGHEYTKSNVKFLVKVLQTDPVKKLQTYADENKETQGKFTIGDEKVTLTSFSKVTSLAYSTIRSIMSL